MTTQTVSDLGELVAQNATFGCIYADPPWSYCNTATRASVGGISKSAYKATMTVEEMCQEPVARLCLPECHLHLWTTNAFLFEAKHVLETWGFEYKSCFVWVKPQMGMGNYWRVSHEFLLLGVKGGLRFRDKSLRSWLEANRVGHSVKPAAIRHLVMKASPGPYLELYGREPSDPDWTIYGNDFKRMLI
jgi:N6-adenosine-specific RNA methylase IME4